MIDRMRGVAVGLLLASGLVLSAGTGAADGPAEPPRPEPRWFTNVTAAVGLEGQRAKSVCLTDLDGDGYFDLVLDHAHLFLSRDQGGRFAPHDDHGLPAPEIRKVVFDKQGKPDLANAKDITYRPHHLYFADVNDDGHVDAIWGVHAWWDRFDGKRFERVEACDPGVRTKVLLGEGGGRFVAAPESGIGADTAYGPAMALAVVDTDLDGRLDIFEGREYRQYGVLHGCGVDHLWKGDGTGAFEDGTEAAGLMTVPEPGGARSSRPTYGVTACDWNDDGWPDLMQMAYGRQWNYLWRNDGTGRFEDVGRATHFAGDAITHGAYPDFVKRPAEKPFRSNGNTFDCAIGDVDGDGDLDCFLGEIAHFWAGEASDLPSLLLNQGAEHDHAFVRRTVREVLPPRGFRTRRWNYGDLHVAFADIDNDGRLDLLIGSGDYPDGQFLRLYRQDERGGFVDATELAGFDWEGCGAISVGDFDRDGDVDIVAGRSFMRLGQAHRDRYMGGLRINEVGVFRNEIGNRGSNHWVSIRLRGKGAGAGTSNRAALGARVIVTTGTRTQIREIRCGSGLAGHQDPPEAHFGLGEATTIDRVEVRWPRSGDQSQVFEDVPVDRFVLLTEDDPTPQIELPGT